MSKPFDEWVDNYKDGRHEYFVDKSRQKNALEEFDLVKAYVGSGKAIVTIVLDSSSHREERWA